LLPDFRIKALYEGDNNFFEKLAELKHLGTRVTSETHS
jgi:hypothetical protein